MPKQKLNVAMMALVSLPGRIPTPPPGHALLDVPYELGLKVILGRNQSKLEAAAAHWGWEETSTDWQAVVARPDIGCRRYSRSQCPTCPHCHRSAKAGKMVWCEKPLATSLPEAETITRLLQFHRLRHGFGFRQGSGQRLSRTKPFFRPWRLRWQWGHVGHWERLYRRHRCRAGDHGLPVRRGFLPPPVRRRGFEFGLIASTDNFQTEFVRDIKEVRDLAEGVGMRPAMKPVPIMATFSFCLAWFTVEARNNPPGRRLSQDHAGCRRSVSPSLQRNTLDGAIGRHPRTADRNFCAKRKCPAGRRRRDRQGTPRPINSDLRRA